MRKRSFLPLVNSTTEILILGSLPGDKSLAENEYYAHPQNRFWKVITSLFNAPGQTNYTEKIDLLFKNNIGLWDVCAEASRPGSMDLAIQNEVPNQIVELLEAHPKITQIIFNGQKAHSLYLKHFNKREDIIYRCLPSTSPANAKSNLENLIKQWCVIISD
ncbi:DNA-deoxyinosine glycosylase [Sphingobacterium siyangense]|uniref:DNA-deoxyinosine glycosylase n=1 Tax=Sphingobacterium siyangense TaxID=459529 RepID=UPI001962500E|nr:DNA-deoxyinosine glycosylase [Sphingobacterium siyangense]QRY60172.1 DNA-deoxyinosine glycosylase [Sphingobacterium siyangense]